MIAAALRLGRILPLLTAALLPATTWAHSTDFILVKVTPRAGGVDVELTADYGGNPMFQDKAEAQAVLTHVLRVRTGESNQTSELTALAPLRFEERRQLDPTAPIPLDPTSGAEPHQLLTGLWSWSGLAAKIAFEMPDDSNQSVILWTPPDSPGKSRGAAKEARWVFLLPGEASPVMAIPPRSSLAWLFSGISVGVVGLSATVGLSAAARRRRPGRN